MLLEKIIQVTKNRNGRNKSPIPLQQPQLSTPGHRVANGYGLAGLVRLQNRLVADQQRVLPIGRTRVTLKPDQEHINISDEPADPFATRDISSFS